MSKKSYRPKKDHIGIQIENKVEIYLFSSPQPKVIGHQDLRQLLREAKIHCNNFVDSVKIIFELWILIKNLTYDFGLILLIIFTKELKIYKF